MTCSSFPNYLFLCALGVLRRWIHLRGPVEVEACCLTLIRPVLPHSWTKMSGNASVSRVPVPGGAVFFDNAEQFGEADRLGEVVGNAEM